MSFFMWRYFIPLFSSEYFRLCGYFLDGSHIIIISNSLQIGFSKKFCTPVLRVSIFDKIDFFIGLPIDYTVTPTRFYFFSFTYLEIFVFSQSLTYPWKLTLGQQRDYGIFVEIPNQFAILLTSYVITYFALVIHCFFFFLIFSW